MILPDLLVVAVTLVTSPRVATPAAVLVIVRGTLSFTVHVNSCVSTDSEPTTALNLILYVPGESCERSYVNEVLLEAVVLLVPFTNSVMLQFLLAVAVTLAVVPTVAEVTGVHEMVRGLVMTSLSLPS